MVDECAAAEPALGLAGRRVADLEFLGPRVQRRERVALDLTGESIEFPSA